MAAVACGLALAGCGFQPMYAKGGGQDGASRAITADLAAVEVGKIPDRSGQMLRNALEQKLERTDGRAAKKYTLSVTLHENQAEVGLRKDNTATRTTLRLDATYRLSQGQTLLSEGTASAFTGYNILNEQYASVMSEKDARERALQELADEITQRLAVYFSGQRMRGQTRP